MTEAEKILENYEKFQKVACTTGARSAAVQEMLDHFGERLAFCPASSNLEYHNAFPGGLVEHSMRVLTYGIKLSKALELSFPTESLIIACLFHDLGKVGDLEDDRYLHQDSSWHRERGMVYKRTEKKMLPVPQQSLFILQHFGIKLTSDEYASILLHDGQYADENKPFRMKEPRMAILVHHADLYATLEEKKLARKHL